MISIVIFIRSLPATRSLDNALEKKKTFALRMLAISVFGWFLELLSMISTTLLSRDEPWAIYMGIPVILFALLGDTVVCVCNLLLIDRSGGLIVLTRHFCCGRRITDPDRNSLGSFTNTSQSGFATGSSSNVQTTESEIPSAEDGPLDSSTASSGTTSKSGDASESGSNSKSGEDDSQSGSDEENQMNKVDDIESQSHKAEENSERSRPSPSTSEPNTSTGPSSSTETSLSGSVS